MGKVDIEEIVSWGMRVMFNQVEIKVTSIVNGFIFLRNRREYIGDFCVE